MIEILYEDQNVIVTVKPPGIDSQARHSFEPDMVSEIRKHLAKLSTTASTAEQATLCGSCPQTGQTRRRGHGLRQESEGCCPVIQADNGWNTEENVSVRQFVENLWIMWKICGLFEER